MNQCAYGSSWTRYTLQLLQILIMNFIVPSWARVFFYFNWHDILLRYVPWNGKKWSIDNLIRFFSRRIFKLDFYCAKTIKTIEIRMIKHTPTIIIHKWSVDRISIHQLCIMCEHVAYCSFSINASDNIVYGLIRVQKKTKQVWNNCDRHAGCTRSNTIRISSHIRSFIMSVSSSWSINLLYSSNRGK